MFGADLQVRRSPSSPDRAGAARLARDGDRRDRPARGHRSPRWRASPPRAERPHAAGPGPRRSTGRSRSTDSVETTPDAADAASGRDRRRARRRDAAARRWAPPWATRSRSAAGRTRSSGTWTRVPGQTDIAALVGPARLPPARRPRLDAAGLRQPGALLRPVPLRRRGRRRPRRSSRRAPGRRRSALRDGRRGAAGGRRGVRLPHALPVARRVRGAAAGRDRRGVVGERLRARKGRDRRDAAVPGPVLDARAGASTRCRRWGWGFVGAGRRRRRSACSVQRLLPVVLRRLSARRRRERRRARARSPRAWGSGSSPRSCSRCCRSSASAACRRSARSAPTPRRRGLDPVCAGARRARWSPPSPASPTCRRRRRGRRGVRRRHGAACSRSWRWRLGARPRARAPASRPGLPWAWRQGLANLHAPGNQTLVLLLTLGLGVFLVLALGARAALDPVARSRCRRPTADGAPDVVLFDVQPDQRDSLPPARRRPGPAGRGRGARSSRCASPPSTASRSTRSASAPTPRSPAARAGRSAGPSPASTARRTASQTVDSEVVTAGTFEGTVARGRRRHARLAGAGPGRRPRRRARAAGSPGTWAASRSRARSRACARSTGRACSPTFSPSSPSGPLDAAPQTRSC